MLRSLLTAALRSPVTAAFTSNVSKTFERKLPNTPLLCNTLNLKPLIASQNFSQYAVPKPCILQTNVSRFLVRAQPMVVQDRSLTKFSLVKGKRKSVKSVIKRFKRLDWGAWIRTHSGRHKRLFKKSAACKHRLRQHIFVNASQSWLLDKMVTQFWRRPKHYIDDPYKPYHNREEYFATRSKPIKY